MQNTALFCDLARIALLNYLMILLRRCVCALVVSRYVSLSISGIIVST